MRPTELARTLATPLINDAIKTLAEGRKAVAAGNFGTAKAYRETALVAIDGAVKVLDVVLNEPNNPAASELKGAE